MTLRRLVSGLLLSLFLPQTVSSGKNCDHPNARVNIEPFEIKDRFVKYEAVVTSDTNPPYATSTITVPLETITTTKTENKSMTEFFLDAGCVVSSGSSIYTLTASATVTQDAATSVSFWDPLKKSLGTGSIQPFASKQTGTHSAVDPNKFRDYNDRPISRHS
ncbi:hypothetical protein INS49_008707 [Diaporthe citri]|uniref:uncharacterized protein n=1 Tax=Diaporthe citri TaxID=83186 RepID=UPI001C7F083C|nr:uncharacterized protein INS49_008707 [Diaporthe citri]KAG6363606.1 hypothetical protein INS49_008707 [Diaporthe citri]